MKKIKFLFLAATVLSLVGCQPNNEGSDAITIIDGLGAEIEIDTSKINRVVCVGAGALRLYSYAGDLSKLVGVEDVDRNVGTNNFENAPRPYYDVNVDYFASLPSIGAGGPAANRTGPNYELVAAAHPDLIFSQFNNANINKQLEEKTGAKVVFLDYGANAGTAIFNDGIKQSLRNIDKIFKTKKGEEIITYMENAKNELENIANKYENKQTAYVGCVGNWGPQSIYSTSGDYSPFEVNGVINVAPSSVGHGTLSKESLINGNPDKIFIDAGGLNKLKEEYATEKTTLAALDAVKNGEVYLEMPGVAYMGNIETMLVNCYYVSSIMYPNEYQSFDIGNKYDEITTKFLGKANYDTAKNKPLSFGGYQKVNLDELFSE